MFGTDVLRPVVPARERSVVWLVSTAHLISHFYLLTLIPLLPILKTALNVSYVQLGLALTIGNICGALAQTPMGFLVDRYGPRKLLMALRLRRWPSFPITAGCSSSAGSPGSRKASTIRRITTSFPRPWPRSEWVARFRIIPSRATSARRSRRRC
jgi:MFS family permease